MSFLNARLAPRGTILGFALLMVLVAAIPSRAQDDAPVLKISSVKIEGNKNVSSLVIFGHLVEKEGDVYSTRRLRMDIHNLFSMGDFSDVKAFGEPGEKQGQVVLVFQVVEKPVIGKIAFVGNKKWDSKKFLEEIKSAPKAPFDRSKLNGDEDIIRKLYQDEGYSNIAVTVKSTELTEKNTVDVTFDIQEGFQIKVGAVTVLGAEAFSAKKVADQMKDNRNGDKYKPDLLGDDLRKIEDFYHDEGYLKAVVLDHHETLVPEKKRVYITLTVKEGEKYVVGNLQFHGNVLFDDDELLKALNLKKGELLRKKDLDEGTRKMKTLYADKAYIYSNVVPQIQYDDELKKADITFEFVEGQPAYVQDVKIVGNYKTLDYVIRRELAINAGDKFEAAKIRLSAQNLYNLGFFDEVNPEVEPGDGPGKEVLVFRVKERHTGSISVGGGYSSVDGFVGNVKISDTNWFGKGWNASLDVEFGALQTSFSASFTEPWLFNTRTSFTLSVFDTDRRFLGAVPDITGSTQLYDEIQKGGSLSLGRRLDRYWTVFGTYSLQEVQITNIGAGETIVGSPSYIAPTDSWTSSFTPRIVYDSRDKYDYPTMGWRHQLSVEFAGGPLGLSNNYIKLIEDTSHFIPLPAGFVFGEHVRFGAGEGYWFPRTGYTDLPLFAKFYAGGTDTIRGYTERSIGPVSGSNALLVSNTEMRHDIVGPLRAIAFFDIGNAWSSIYNLNEYNLAANEGGLQMGTGIGARLTIPGTLIAIRLDYGWPIDTDLSTAVAPRGGTLHFNLGDLF
ncbi:MAG TPA: outer membrane protein assembly factor BamA [bacterium]|nr:outer membrane protein assembly factor BamA [bacterium]